MQDTFYNGGEQEFHKNEWRLWLQSKRYWEKLQWSIEKNNVNQKERTKFKEEAKYFLRQRGTRVQQNEDYDDKVKDMEKN